MQIPSDIYETIVQTIANAIPGLDPSDVEAIKAARGWMSVGAYERDLGGVRYICPVLTATDFDPLTTDDHPLEELALDFDRRMRSLYSVDFDIFEVV